MEKNYEDNDINYTLDLSNIINKKRQDFFNRIQDNIKNILGDNIEIELRYDDYLYYEVFSGKKKYFKIHFKKSHWTEEYTPVISFGDIVSYEFISKSSLIDLLKKKKIL